jgi:hypothetical protein
MTHKVKEQEHIMLNAFTARHILASMAVASTTAVSRFDMASQRRNCFAS